MINYTDEDMLDHDTVAAVIRNEVGDVLMQDHVKFGFWTLPVGKAKQGQAPIEGIKREIFEECNLVIEKLKEISCLEKVYDRDGKIVKCLIHVYDVLVHSGEMKNNEPDKHAEQKFLPVEDIMRLPYVSDCTLMFLRGLGLERGARLDG